MSNPTNPISHFVDLLDEWEYHYPLPSQWAVSIPLPTAINGSLESTIQSLEDKDWSIEESRNSLTKNEVISLGRVHCFFVDSATLAGENFTVGSAKIGDGSNNGGLIQGLISNGRGDFASRTVNIAFRETAQSFADFIIRPWVILASHLGRIADRSEEIKANITVYNYGKSFTSNTPFVTRKIYKYYGCIPSAVEAQELNYGGDSSIITYKTAWQFDRYSISNAATEQGALRKEILAIPERSAARAAARERVISARNEQNRIPEFPDLRKGLPQDRGPARQIAPIFRPF